MVISSPDSVLLDIVASAVDSTYEGRVPKDSLGEKDSLLALCALMLMTGNTAEYMIDIIIRQLEMCVDQKILVEFGKAVRSGVSVVDALKCFCGCSQSCGSSSNVSAISLD